MTFSKLPFSGTFLSQIRKLLYTVPFYSYLLQFSSSSHLRIKPFAYPCVQCLCVRTHTFMTDDVHIFLLALSSLPSTHLFQKVMIATSTTTANFQEPEEPSTIHKYNNQSPIARSRRMESAIIVTTASSCMASALRGRSSIAVQCPGLLIIQMMGYAGTQCCSCAVVISFQQTDTKRQWCQQRSKVQGLRTEEVLEALASYCSNWLSSAFSSLGAVCVKAILEAPATGEGMHKCCHRVECLGSGCKLRQSAHADVVSRWASPAGEGAAPTNPSLGRHNVACGALLAPGSSSETMTSMPQLY